MTTLEFLDSVEQARFDVILAQYNSPEFELAFAQALRNPPIDASQFLIKYPIPPEEAQVVLETARLAILIDPRLAFCSEELTGKVETTIIRYYGSMGLVGLKASKTPCKCAKLPADPCKCK